MASTHREILLIFIIGLVLFVHINHGYRLYDTDDIIEHPPMNSRSVLWPKICFTTFIKKSEHYPAEDNNQHRSSRNIRKCYPLDTA